MAAFAKDLPLFRWHGGRGACYKIMSLPRSTKILSVSVYLILLNFVTVSFSSQLESKKNPVTSFAETV